MPAKMKAGIFHFWKAYLHYLVTLKGLGSGTLVGIINLGGVSYGNGKMEARKRTDPLETI